MVHLLLKPTLKLLLLSWAFAMGITPAVAGVMLDSDGEPVATGEAGGIDPPVDAPYLFAPVCEPGNGMVNVERTGAGNSLAVLSPSSPSLEPHPCGFCISPEGTDAGRDIPEEIFRPA